jgi:hypothetical protein
VTVVTVLTVTVMTVVTRGDSGGRGNGGDGGDIGELKSIEKKDYRKKSRFEKKKDYQTFFNLGQFCFAKSGLSIAESITAFASMKKYHFEYYCGRASILGLGA